MGRPHRVAEGGFVYHVLNRGNARMHLFDDERDYDAFDKVLAEAAPHACAQRRILFHRALCYLDLRQNLLHDFSLHVGQAVITPLEFEHEPRVIDAQAV
jgi:hypothetical protein